MDNFLHLPMFLYKGNRKWQNTIKEWNDTELATLYHCLDVALDNTDHPLIRANIVYLMEKLYRISDVIDIDDLNYDENYDNEEEE